MGSFHTLVEIGNLNGAEFESVEALVDTGAVYSMLPGSLLRDTLGLTPMEEINLGIIYQFTQFGQKPLTPMPQPCKLILSRARR